MPQLKLIEDGSAYEYERRRLDRVTEIVGTVFPPYLLPWGEKVGREAAYEIYKDLGYLPEPDQIKRLARQRGIDCESQKLSGGSRGTAIHGCLERYIKEGEVPSPADVDAESAPYVQSLAAFLLDYRPEFQCSELTVLHTELGYAGTLDAYSTITKQPPGKNKPWNLEGKRIILDTKTNREARTYFPQHHYQLAGYRLAWDFLDLPPVDHEIILALGPAKGWKARYQVCVNYVPASEFGTAIATYRSLQNARKANPNGRKSG